MKKMLQENIIKNLVVFALLIAIYPIVRNSLLNSSVVTDKTVIGNLLIAVGIFAVIACFGNFAFTYEDVERRNYVSRILAHVTTGLLMFLIGLSLEMTSVLSSILIPNFFIFDLALAILYFASVLYDFWDLHRKG